MPIELNCPGCGKQLRLADEHAGKAGRCPACQATFQIPTAAAEQFQSSPFGAGSGPAQPFGSSPGFPQNPPPPAGNPFGGQNPPNPFASTSGMPSPYGGVNPYSSPQTPNMYGGAPSSGEGTATASMILGIVSIVFSFIPCCCMNLWIGGLCGVIGLVLAFQIPPEQRKVGLILNIIGLSISALTIVGAIIWYAVLINNAGNNGQFN